MFSKLKTQGKFVALTTLSAIGALPLAAHADDSATAGAAAVNGLVAGQGGYLTAMIALALAGVGISIAVKWVKRAKGAA